MTATEGLALAVGFIASFAVAFLVVGRFLSFLGKHSLKPFAYYRLAVGTIMIFIAALGLL